MRVQGGLKQKKEGFYIQRERERERERQKGARNYIFFDTTQRSFSPGTVRRTRFNVYVVDKKNLVGDWPGRCRDPLAGTFDVEVLR